MKNKKIYGFVLLALIIMLLPIGMVSAKYKQTKEVGTVTLDIAPPILSPNWYTQVDTDATISELIVDSFKPEANSDIYSKLGLNWEDGIPVGYDSSNPDSFKNNVRLFEKDNHYGTYNAYILAIGNNPVTFPIDSSSLFAGWKKTNVTKKITFNNIDTSAVNNMQYMFWRCESLTSLDISSFNTSNVKDMNNMFAGCNSMTSLKLGDNFNTSNVTNMADMFNVCNELISLDVSNFNTPKVTNMSQMFNGCKKLTVLNLSNFNTSKVTNMKFMFNNCAGLTSLRFSNNFNTEKVTDMSGMFGSCISLQSLNLSSFNTTNVTDMNNMFYDCSTLTSLYLSNFTTPNLKDMSKMFMQCSKLDTLDLSKFRTSEGTKMTDIFTQCNKLRKVTLGGEFIFNYSSDKKALLPGQSSNDIPDATGLWYISNSGPGYNSTQAAEYHNQQKTTTTYYAVQSEAPSSTNTFSLLTENGTINGAIQGN